MTWNTQPEPIDGVQTSLEYVYEGGIQTLTNKTIDLGDNTLTGTTAEFNTALSDDSFATLTNSGTLTNKTIDLASNTLTGTVAQFNTALSGDNFVTLTGSETLTNKVLTAPTLTSPVVSTGAITLTSGQIAFPATQAASADANTLDDYEEGTWTPSVGGSATYTTQSGTYTKIGRLVYVNCRLTINAIGTGSTRIISGLPFTASGSHPGTCSGFASLASTVVLLAPAVLNGTTTIDMLSLTAAGSAIGTNAIFGNNTDVFVSASYHV